MFAMLISAALRGPTGRTRGGPAGIPGIGGFGRCLIAAGGPAKMFSGCASHSSSESANFASETSKFSRTPEKVEITIADISSKVDLLKWLIVMKLASKNFCSSLMLVTDYR